jgi:hypothetical protein
MVGTCMALLIGAQSASNAQIFPDGGCSICPSALPVVADVVLPSGTADVLTEDQTCAETELSLKRNVFCCVFPAFQPTVAVKLVPKCRPNLQ